MAGELTHAISVLNSQKKTLTEQIKASQEKVESEETLIKKRQAELDQVDDALALLQGETGKRDMEIPRRKDKDAV